MCFKIPGKEGYRVFSLSVSRRRLLGSLSERESVGMRRTVTEEPKQELTIEEAIRRAQNGDADAFECLYNSHCECERLRRIWQPANRSEARPRSPFWLSPEPFLIRPPST